MLKDYRLPPANGGKPGRAVIFLHGVGDSGAGGLLSIGQIWQRDLPDCAFFCPDAPFPFDMAPIGYQWFSLQSHAPEDMLAGAKNAAPYLNEYIDHILTTQDLPPERLTLVGFSQGTMMALYVAPRRVPSVACVVGYSGLLTGGDMLRAEKKSAPSVLLVHGKMDDVVPFVLMDEAEKALKAAGIPVTTLACPTIGHTIDDVGLREGLIFIKKIWGS